MTITVGDKRIDHAKPLPSCLNIEKEDFFRLLQITFFSEYFYIFHGEKTSLFDMKT